MDTTTAAIILACNAVLVACNIVIYMDEKRRLDAEFDERMSRLRNR